MASLNGPHIVALPAWVLALRVLQTILAVIVLALAAYGVHFVPYNAYCLALFTTTATIIVLIYNFVASYGWASGYNYWAILALDMFCVIFWVSTMGILAALSAIWDYAGDCSDVPYCYKKRDLHAAKRADITTYGTYRNVLAASASFAGLELILFVITLVAFSIHMHRHRKSGAPNKAGGSSNHNDAYEGGVAPPVNGVYSNGPEKAYTNEVVEAEALPQRHG